MRWRSPLALALIGLFTTAFIDLAHGTEPGAPPPVIAEADAAAIFSQISGFAHDLERLRRFMGTPRINELDIGIRSAIPRDLYFQALTLCEKVDRLSFEISRERAKPLPTPAGDIGPQDILGRLRDAHQSLRQVIDYLQIADTGPADESKPATPDFFSATLNLNRQLNLLLERHISPSDVYQEITLAIGYSARLLARYPDADRIPSEPLFEPNKQPADVYLRLIECLQSITRIFDRLGLAVLNIDTSQTDLERLTPGDVHLVATMIVSQLDFLHKRLDIAKPPPQPIYPGLKFPAHNYQRMGILLTQLKQLEHYLATDRLARPLLAPPQ